MTRSPKIAFAHLQSIMILHVTLSVSAITRAARAVAIGKVKDKIT